MELKGYLQPEDTTICCGHRPLQFIVIRGNMIWEVIYWLFAARGHHNLLWPKDTTFENSHIGYCILDSWVMIFLTLSAPDWLNFQRVQTQYTRFHDQGPLNVWSDWWPRSSLIKLYIFTTLIQPMIPCMHGIFNRPLGLARHLLLPQRVSTSLQHMTQRDRTFFGG